MLHVRGNYKNQNAVCGIRTQTLEIQAITQQNHTLPKWIGSACLCVSVCLRLCPVTFILFQSLYLTLVFIIHFRNQSSVCVFVYVLLYMLSVCVCVVCQQSLNQLGHRDGNNYRSLVLFKQTFYDSLNVLKFWIMLSYLFNMFQGIIEQIFRLPLLSTMCCIEKRIRIHY